MALISSISQRKHESWQISHTTPLTTSAQMPYFVCQMAQKVRIEPSSLNRELALKGLTPEQFSTEAKVSLPTLYRALRGDDITSRSMTRILVALGRIPSLDVPTDLVRAS